MNVKRWPIDRIEPDPKQPRLTLDPETIERLAADIAARGLLQPLIGWAVGDRLRLIDGHCRLAALKLAGKADADVILVDSEPDASGVLMVQLAANCLRADLKPVEKAKAFQRLKQAKKWNNTELAEALHLSKAHVTECLSHLSHSAEVQAMIDDGRISGSTAYAVSRETDEAVREALLAQAMDGKLSRAEASRRVKRRADGKPVEHKAVFTLSEATFVATAREAFDLEELASMFRRLAQECRSGAAQGFDIGTLERVLTDKARASGASTNGSAT